MSAESEFRASGWPRLTCRLAAVDGLFLALGLLLALGDLPIRFNLGPIPVRVPILVVFLAALALQEGVRFAQHRSLRYVIGADGVLRVLGGVFREGLRAEVPPSRVSGVADERGVPVVSFDHGTRRLALAGAPPEMLDALRRAWPYVPIASEPSAPRHDARPVVALALAFVLVSLGIEVLGFLGRRATDERDGRILVAVNAARASVVKLLTRPGTTVVDGSFGDTPPFASIYGATWDVRIDEAPPTTGAPAGPLASKVAVEVVAIPCRAFATPRPVRVELLGGSQDGLFLGELKKELDAAGVTYTVLGP
jgi:hypothetical protein